METDANRLYYMHARYYNPHLRRFINADPAGLAGGMNFYAYADGDPISMIDPSGLGATPAERTQSQWVPQRHNPMLDDGPDVTFDDVVGGLFNFAGGVFNTPWTTAEGFANDVVTAVSGKDTDGKSVSTGKRVIAGVMVVGNFVPGTATARAVKTVSRIPLTNFQLVQRAATKADDAIVGTSRFAGTAKHDYATALLERYQRRYGDRGLKFDVAFNNGPGNRGFLDVLDMKNSVIYDWKFGYPTRTLQQLNSTPQMIKYRRNWNNMPTVIIRP